ncbi:zeta toxin family protein [Nocardia paucivorans]|uniref:zeta toxin family protein n=1 Tax=Nocardia paucivorans TaxID=114259 RepID=UPI003570B493
MRHIFEEQIVRELLDGTAVPLRRPELIVVSGQPAAGKTTVIHRLARSYRDRGGAVVLIADDYMRYHPRFHRLRVRDDSTAGDHIYPFAEKWLDMAVDHAIAGRRRVILEEGVGNPARAVDIVRRFGDNDYADYASRLDILAVHRERSRLSNLLRYLEERLRYGTGRYVPLRGAGRVFRRFRRSASSARIRRIAGATRRPERAVTYRGALRKPSPALGRMGRSDAGLGTSGPGARPVAYSDGTAGVHPTDRAVAPRYRHRSTAAARRRTRLDASVRGGRRTRRPGVLLELRTPVALLTGSALRLIAYVSWVFDWVIGCRISAMRPRRAGHRHRAYSVVHPGHGQYLP